MHTPPDQHVCRVCRRPLNSTQIYVGETLTKTRWTHGYEIPGTPGHIAEPILASEVNNEIVGVCDFCSEPGPRWRYPAESFEENLTPCLGIGSVADWGACDTCHLLIQNEDWRGLADRFIECEYSNISRDYRRVLRKQILEFHQKFRKSRSGEPEAIY